MRTIIGNQETTNRWTKEQVDRVVRQLCQEFPGESAARINDVVMFCKGAVFSSEGLHKLERFSRGLLQELPGTSASDGGQDNGA